MQACYIRLPADKLRELLGLPEKVRITAVLPSITRINTYVVQLEGIGPKLFPGAVLQQVDGKVNLNVENGLEWDIS